MVKGLLHCHKRMIRQLDKKALLSQGEPRDTAVNFDTYRILQRHRADSLPQHGFLVYSRRRFKRWTYTQYADFHGRDAKSRAIVENHGTRPAKYHGKSHIDREYVIILQWLTNCFTTGMWIVGEEAKGREGCGKTEFGQDAAIAWKKKRFLCNHISHVPVT